MKEGIETNNQFMLLVKEGWEINYGPISGYICITNGNEEKYPKTWPEHHELIEKFQNLKKDEYIVKKETTTQIHSMFNYHSGRVDIYIWNKEK